MTNSHDVVERSNQTEAETEAETPDVISAIQGGDNETTSDTLDTFEGGKGIAVNETIVTYMEADYVEPTPEDENVKVIRDVD